MQSNRLGGLWDGEMKHQAGSIWDINGLAPTIDTMTGGGREPHIIEVKELEKVFAIDEQNMLVRSETIGTLTTDGNSPKHNNRVAECQQIKIRQATEQGYALCEIGGQRTWNIQRAKQDEEE